MTNGLTAQEQNPHASLIDARRLLEQTMPRTEAAEVVNCLTHEQVDDLLACEELPSDVLESARKQAMALRAARTKRSAPQKGPQRAGGREGELLHEYENRLQDP